MSKKSEIQLSIIDDCGLLAIVDAPSYSSFIGPDWKYESLLEHFATETAKGAILVWECGDGGGDYRIEISNGFTDTAGFRVAVGAIKVSNGVLNIASYNALTMAAQFEEYNIPSQHEIEAAFNAPSASTRVRVVQMYDPEDYENQPRVHFLIEVEAGDAPFWTEVQWESASSYAKKEPPLPQPIKRKGFLSSWLRRR